MEKNKIVIRLNNDMEMALIQDEDTETISCGITMDGEPVGKVIELSGEDEDKLFQFCRKEFL